jgi:hypothetical protein
MTTTRVHANGIDIHYVEAGEGEQLLRTARVAAVITHSISPYIHPAVAKRALLAHATEKLPEGHGGVPRPKELPWITRRSAEPYRSR